MNVLFVLRAMLASLLVASCASVGPPSGSPSQHAATAPTSAPTPTRLPSPRVTPSPTPSPSASPSLGASPASAATGVWSLVAVGDSLPYNSPADCPGCTSYVDRYAGAIVKATGHRVSVRNLSEHTGLQTDGLLRELEGDTVRREALAGADIIIVSIGYNDAPWGRDDDPCDGPYPQDQPIDWSKYDAACAVASAEAFRAKLERVFALVLDLRAGKPTLIRTTNRYNDWIGWSQSPPSATEPSRQVVDAWSGVMCEAAESHDVVCADIYHAFNGPDGLTPSGDLLADDYTHPSDKGNQRIADVLADLGYAPLWP